MGAPKQKWTPEEEAALKAGVVKHGAGKWRTILKDPEFSGVLYLRSNVDLKDKWRNMSVMAHGWGSREKSRLAVKRAFPLSKQEENSMATMGADQSDEEMGDIKPLAISGPTTSVQAPAAHATKRQNLSSRLDSLIMEAITTLKETGGSNKTSIAAYIEEQYWAPPDFKRLLSSKLKGLMACHKLVKVKRKYRIPPMAPSSERERDFGLGDGKQRVYSPKIDRDEVNIVTRSQIDLELAKMRNMTSQEADTVAARAVADAEAAIAAAEAAAREAETAEVDAEAAQTFAASSSKTLKGRNNSKPMIRA